MDALERSQRRINWISAIALALLVAWGARGCWRVVTAGFYDPQALEQLKAGIQPGDVQVYGTAWCPGTQGTREWLSGQQIPYETCDIETDAVCSAGYKRFRKDGRVPLVVVRGNAMAPGFEVGAFMDALQREPRPPAP